MSIKSIRTISIDQLGKADAFVRRISNPVDFLADDVPRLVSDLRDTFYASKISVGLAAIQIGVERRLFIANPDKGKAEQELLAINPTILDSAGSKDKKFESCMSVPNWRSQVKRRDRLTLRYQLPSGEELDQQFSGFFARIIFHEMDHLDGVLCHDHAENKAAVEEFHFQTDENYPLPPIAEA